jgi:hypothetical protein
MYYLEKFLHYQITLIWPWPQNFLRMSISAPHIIDLVHVYIYQKDYARGVFVRAARGWCGVCVAKARRSNFSFFGRGH